MKILRIIPDSEVPLETLEHIKRTARQVHRRFTVFEGLVTRQIYICLHEGEQPSSLFTQLYEREEFDALALAGRTVQ